MAHECDFSLRVALTSIYKGFKKSPDVGWQTIKSTKRDLDSLGKSDFSTSIQIRVDPKTGDKDLFWDGYGRSIEESMRRYVAYLKVTGASKERIEQALVELKTWRAVKQVMLGLEEGQEVNYFSFRDVDRGVGVALQSVAMRDGQLVLDSYLLPFTELDQVNRFMNLMSNGRQKLDLNISKDALLSLAGWAVKGKAIDFRQDLPEMIQESLWVNQQEVGMPIHTMTESMSGGAGIGMGDVHFGSVHEEVSVTEVPVYALPVVADAQPHPRGGVEVVALKPMTDHQVEKYQEHKSVKVIRETITEGMEVTESTEKVVMPVMMMTTPAVVTGQVAEYKELKSVKGEKVITESTEVTESTEENSVVSGSSVDSVIEEAFGITESTEEIVVSMVTRMIPISRETTVTEFPIYGEITVSQVNEAEKVVEDDSDLIPVVVEQQVSAQVQQEVGDIAEMISDVHLGSVHGPKEEVITEVTELAEGTEKLELRKRKFSDFSFDSVSSVIKETFDKKLAERKSVKSVKEKIAWLQRQVANVVADQLIGRNTDEPVLGWLVHGWVMMRFDGIEEKQKVKRFGLSPVRIWADRVTGAARRVKDKFVRTGFSVYKQLFAAI